MRAKGFPGTDDQTGAQFVKDVCDDERAILEAIRSVRQEQALSLEEIGFLLGVGAGQISRYLRGNRGTTLVNYLRITRALGYRFCVVLEKVDEPDQVPQRLLDLKITRHRVRHARPDP
jgi:transcriptional regulator with XRE-family HTH domain